MGTLECIAAIKYASAQPYHVRFIIDFITMPTKRGRTGRRMRGEMPVTDQIGHTQTQG